MIDPIKWMSLELVLTLHDESLVLFGGSPGVRDHGLLESALGRPQNLYAYQADATLFDLATAYCAGIVRNHPFIDGNKRAGLLAARTFLFLNGYHLDPSEVETVSMIEGLAARVVSEDALTEWLKSNSKPIALSGSEG